VQHILKHGKQALGFIQDHNTVQAVPLRNFSVNNGTPLLERKIGELASADESTLDNHNWENLNVYTK
jgi:hypothetical protein